MLSQTEQYLIGLGSGILAPIGYEADDVMATLATKAESMSKLIYSGDYPTGTAKHTRFISACRRDDDDSVSA